MKKCENAKHAKRVTNSEKCENCEKVEKGKRKYRVSDENECSICYSTYSGENPPRRLRCGHKFHRKCIGTLRHITLNIRDICHQAHRRKTKYIRNH